MDQSKNILFILYDGIENSVFLSMVLQPLQKQMDSDKHLHVTLVSFQSHAMGNKQLLQKLNSIPRLQVILISKIIPWGNQGLALYAMCLACVLNKKFDTIIARGPFAGLIVLKAYTWKRFFLKNYKPSIIIQARGLCGEEYRYMQEKNKNYKGFEKFFKIMRYWLLVRKERKAYQLAQKINRNGINVSIEAVSDALKQYMIDRFNINATLISIAQHDGVRPALHSDIDCWKQEMRTKLGIKPDAYVYCYSGSYKPWQCVDQTIDYFKKQYETNKNAFLVIYSADKQSFEKHLLSVGLDKQCCLVVSAPADQLLMYIAVADAGILLREPDIINWVSRPTKMLEYQAVGLEIIHNNTVECLARLSADNSDHF